MSDKDGNDDIALEDDFYALGVILILFKESRVVNKENSLALGSIFGDEEKQRKILKEGTLSGKRMYRYG